jgi:hypothetical protein
MWKIRYLISRRETTYGLKPPSGINEKIPLKRRRLFYSLGDHTSVPRESITAGNTAATIDRLREHNRRARIPRLNLGFTNHLGGLVQHIDAGIFPVPVQSQLQRSSGVGAPREAHCSGVGFRDPLGNQYGLRFVEQSSA